MSESLKDNIAWFLNRTDEKGNTILHYVAKTNNVDFAKQLIKAGCDVNGINGVVDQPIQNYQESIAWFLKQTDEKRNTILHYVAKTNNVDFAKQLIEAGCNVNKMNNSGITPTAYAVVNGQLDMVKKLLRLGAKNVKDPFQRIKSHESSLLHLAIEYNWPDIVELLIAAGVVNVNERNTYFETPLHAAVYKKNENDACKVIKFLIEAGADLSAENIQSETPFCNAFARVSNVVFDLMLSLSPESRRQINLDYKFLDIAFKSANLVKFMRLIELGLDIHVLFKGGLSCLHVALYRGHYRAVEYLLNNNVDMYVLNDKGDDSLCYSLKEWSMHYDGRYSTYDEDSFYHKDCDNFLRCFNLMLDNGYNVNHFTGDNTPLYSVLKYYSTWSNCFSRELLKHGAKFDFEHPLVQQLFDDSPNSTLAHLLLRHTAMFKAQNRNDGSENFNFDKLDKSCQDYYASCQDELKAMKKKIDNTTVSFFSILVNRDIGPYTRNELVTKAFKTTNFTALFPIYHDLLTERFSKELEYQELVTEATPGLSNVLNMNEDAYHLIFKNIRQYLYKKDLSNLANV